MKFFKNVKKEEQALLEKISTMDPGTAEYQMAVNSLVAFNGISNTQRKWYGDMALSVIGVIIPVGVSFLAYMVGLRFESGGHFLSNGFTKNVSNKIMKF